MIEFGKTLRTAREAKGITISQIAEKTHMLVQIVEGLENENFEKIAAPIYGRGFVKLYCEAVGLNPKPMIEEFMTIFSGDRRHAPGGGEKAEASAEPQVKPAVAQPPPPMPMPANESSPAEPPVARPDPVKPPEFDFTSTGGSRYSAPMPIDDGPRAFTLPKINWRLAVLALAALAVVFVIFSGIRALYRATMSENVCTGEECRETADAAGQTGAEDGEQVQSATLKAPADRKPLPVKPFYLD
jgi:transcriptional regulator with XRE-family HTH domain